MSPLGVRALVVTLAFLGLTTPSAVAQQPSPQPSINRMSTAELLQCAASGTCNESDWDVASQLRDRLSVHRILAMYRQQTPRVKTIFIYALYTARGPQVESLMREAAFSNLQPGPTGEDNRYCPLQYLAKLCDKRALKELNREDNFKEGYPVGCMQWQSTLAAFGKCGYKPAVPHLAESLNSACVDNTVAADKSLRKLMPKSQCWKKASLQEDFRAETGCYVKEAESAKHP